MSKPTTVTTPQRVHSSLHPKESPQIQLCMGCPCNAVRAAPCKAMMLRSSWICWFMSALRPCMVPAVLLPDSVCVTVAAAPVCWRQSVTSNRTSTMAPAGTAHPAPAFSHLLVASLPQQLEHSTHSPFPFASAGHKATSKQLLSSEKKGRRLRPHSAPSHHDYGSSNLPSPTRKQGTAKRKGYVTPGASQHCRKDGLGPSDQER